MSGRRDAVEEVDGLLELLVRQAGMARRSQLRRLGVTSHQVAARRWRLVAPEVVSVDNGRLDHEQRWWRAALHAPHGWIGGRSALEHAGLRGYVPDAVHLLVACESRPARLDGVRIHVTYRPPETSADVALGLPVCAVPRACVDAAAWEDNPRAAAGVVLAAVQHRLATPAEVLAELAVAGRVRHRAVIRDALADAGAGADSLAEVDAAVLVRRAGLPAPRRQALIAGARRDLAVDLADGSTLVIEVDGVQHDTPEARWADADRDAALTAAGVLVLRIPAFAVRRDPARVQARLSAINKAAQARAAQR